MGSGKGQIRRAQRRVPVAEATGKKLQLSGTLGRYDSDIVIEETSSSGMAECSVAEEVMKNDLIGKYVVVRLDDGARRLSERRVRECLRGRLVFDGSWRLCLQELDVVGGNKQLLMAQLAAHKGKVVRLSIEEAEPVLLELERVTF